MPVPSPLNPLTNYQEDLCTYGGTFGALLSVTCFIQHLIFALSNWVTLSMNAAYIFIIVAFVLLAFQKSISPVLIIIGTVLSMIIESVWIHDFSFSLAVLFLFLYHGVILVLLFAENIPKKLKQKADLKRNDEEQWAGKI